MAGKSDEVWNVPTQIFTTFFTTKKGGNDTGLSLSRQIMRSMGGMTDKTKAAGANHKNGTSGFCFISI